MSSQVAPVSSVYDRIDEHPFHHSLLAALCIEVGEPKPGECVLDLACGGGIMAFKAEQRVGPHGVVIGVDISDGLLDLARRRAQQCGSNLSFIQHDICNLSGAQLPPGGFDLIICAPALVLLPRPLQTIRHWATLLKPGGRLVMNVNARDVDIPKRIFAEIGQQIGKPLEWDPSWFENGGLLSHLHAATGLREGFIIMHWGITFEGKDHRADRAADGFERCVLNPAFRNFADPSIRDEVKRLFVEKFLQETGSDGLLLDVESVLFTLDFK